MGHAEVARILMSDDGDGEGSDELAGGVLQQADADRLAEALEAGAVGSVRIRANADGGDADDGAEVGGGGEVVESEVALLLPRHRNDHLSGEEALVGVDELAAGLADLIEAIRVDVDDLHG